MAGILTAVLGETVDHVPRASGVVSKIPAIFREQAIAVPDDNGREIVAVLPVLSVNQPLAASVLAGDTIRPGNGKSYRVIAPRVSDSPASDALVTFEMELDQ